MIRYLRTSHTRRPYKTGLEYAYTHEKLSRIYLRDTLKSRWILTRIPMLTKMQA